MDIKIYTNPWSKECEELRKFLRSKKVKFTELDVTKNTKAAMEMIDKSRQSNVPVLDIDGNIIAGFNAKKIEKILGK